MLSAAVICAQGALSCSERNAIFRASSSPIALYAQMMKLQRIISRTCLVNREIQMVNSTAQLHYVHAQDMSRKLGRTSWPCTYRATTTVSLRRRAFVLDPTLRRHRSDFGVVLVVHRHIEDRNRRYYQPGTATIEVSSAEQRQPWRGKHLRGNSTRDQRECQARPLQESFRQQKRTVVAPTEDMERGSSEYRESQLFAVSYAVPTRTPS